MLPSHSYTAPVPFAFGVRAKLGANVLQPGREARDRRERRKRFDPRKLLSQPLRHLLDQQVAE